MAVTGGIRAARRAGEMADTRVISAPASRATITVRGLIASPVAWQIEAEGRQPGLEHDGEADPRDHARDRGDHADDQGLAEDRGHNLSAARSDGTKQGQLAEPLGDDDRERVEDDGRPDEQGDEREDEQEHADEAQRLVDGLLPSAVTAWPLTTSIFGS